MSNMNDSSPNTNESIGTLSNVASSSQYGSFDSANIELPPKPAIRQRTTKQYNNNLTDPQDKMILSEDSDGRKVANKLDKHQAELKAELEKKLSLTRLRLEQSNDLERQLKERQDDDVDDDDDGNNNNNNNNKPSSDLIEPYELSKASKQKCLSLSVDNFNNKLDNQQQIKRGYPKKVLIIVASEFCERFSYYGLRAVLVLYFKSVFGFSDSNSTISFHLFTTICYLTPILGAILADSIWGKYKTILYLSLVYFLGESVLVLSSIFWNYGQLSILLTFFGLFLIALGTGGIKPCVSALGGDQFLPHEIKWRQSFFSIFYAAINVGSLISIFVTPILRNNFKCVSRNDCFPYAFGLPCLLMLSSIVVFLLAKNHYHLVPLPEQNVIISFCKCVWLAFRRKLTRKKPAFLFDDNLIETSQKNTIKQQESGTSNKMATDSTSSSDLSVSSNEYTSVGNLKDFKNNSAEAIVKKDNHHDGSKRRSHWLYLASDRFDSISIEAARSVLAILLLFAPASVYWCLYDQQASLWTLQATRMEGRIFGTNFTLQPDQMSVANPVILLATIPLFQVFIYPTLGKFNLLTKPIQRMTTGGFLASIAFLSSAAIESGIQNYLPPSQPTSGSAQLILVNGLPECSIQNPMISYIPQIPSSIILNTADKIPIAATDNQTASLPVVLSTNDISFKSMKLLPIESLAAQSISIKSINSSSLINNYLLKIELTDSMKQIESNKSIGCPIDPKLEHKFSFGPLPDQSTRLMYIELGNGKLAYKLFNESLELPQASKARVRLLYEFFGSSSVAEKRSFSLEQFVASTNGSTSSSSSTSLPGKATFVPLVKDGQVILSNYVDVDVPASGSKFILKTNENGSNNNPIVWNNNNIIFLKPGTRNLIMIHQSDSTHLLLNHQLLQDNNYRISILYQLIPYTLISMSEVMFSITGFEFSYSVAPSNMKSVILAMFSLTVAFGNLLTVFIESLHLFDNIAYEFTFYAALMSIDMLLFATLGYYFKPNRYHGRH